MGVNFVVIIGTFAYCGSGQDTIADGLCKYKGFVKYSLGDVLRDIATHRHLPHSRDVLRDIRKECDSKHGRRYIPERLIEMIQKEENKNVVITGIRTIEEYKLFRCAFDIIFVFVYANEEIRLQRMLRRKDAKDCRTISGLREDMKKEFYLFDYKLLESLYDYCFNFEMDIQTYINSEQSVVETFYEAVLQLKGGVVA